VYSRTHKNDFDGFDYYYDEWLFSLPQPEEHTFILHPIPHKIYRLETN
jgi:hypothetical protein